MKRLILFFIAVFLMTSPAFAGGPFVVDSKNDSGVAQQWKDKTLPWYSDDSALANTVTNVEAVTWVNDAINMWIAATLENTNRENVSTVDAQATYMNSLGVDVDESNFADYTNSDQGKTVIIFDKGGAIVTSLYGAEDAKGYAGFSGILLSDSNGTKILKGFVVLNGLLIDEGTLTEDEFKGVILHEIGHLFNLDHTQVNLDIAEACKLGGSCDDGQYIPTMFPALKTKLQGSKLSIDDKATISWLYPNSTFDDSFCTITGEIQDRDGKTLQGVNVIARRVGDGDQVTKEDSRSMVSGVLYPACNPDGHYYLRGIVPGKTYEVIYEPLTSTYTGVSGFEPLPNPPTGFETGTIGTVKCDSGGETRQMPTVKVDVANPCVFEEEDGDGATGATKSGGCSLIR